MGRSWLLSALLHAALAVVLWFGLPGWSRPLPAIESGITVELVTEAELKPPEPEVAAVAPEPEHQAARPQPTPPTPRPEPAPAVQTPPEPAPPEPAPVAEPEPPPEPVVAQPEPESETAPEPEPEVARAAPEPAPPPEPEPTPKPAPVAEPEPAPERQAALEPQPPPRTAPPRPRPPAALPKPQARPTPPPTPKPEPAQVKAKPQPAPPEPAPPAHPKEEDEFLAMLRSVEEMPRQVQGEVRQDGTGRHADAAGQARSAVGDGQITQSERDALYRQITRNWILPVGAEDIQDVVVQLRIQVGPDRRVQRVIIQDQARLERDPAFRAVAESAHRAVERSSPLQLPPDKYTLWRDLVLNFSPQDAVGG